MLPRHDLAASKFLFKPNAWQTIQLVAVGSTTGDYRDGRQVFAYDDPAPYSCGWLAFRTVHSHIRIRHFRVDRLKARS